jgi:hypothetical protein
VTRERYQLQLAKILSGKNQIAQHKVELGAMKGGGRKTHSKPDSGGKTKTERPGDLRRWREEPDDPYAKINTKEKTPAGN